MKKSVSSGKKKVKSKSSSSAAAASGASSALSADVVAQLSDTHKRFALRAGDDCPTTHITVFSDRAEVVREVSLDAAEIDATGVYDIVISGITLVAQTDSFRAQPSDDEAGAVRILDVSNEREPYDYGAKEHVKSDKTKELEEQVEKVTAALGVLADETKVVDDQRSWLTRYADGMLGGNNKAPLIAVDDVDKMLELTSSKQTAFNEQLRELSRKKGELNDELTRLRRELSDEKALSGHSDPNLKRTVTLTIFCEAGTAVKLNLTYIVSNASWHAEYDARVDREASTMQLLYFGNITNNTNEHWRNTKIVLSTAKPAAGGAPPKMYTKRVSLSSGRSHVQKQMSSAANPLYQQSNMMVQQQMIVPQAFGGDGDSSDSDLELAPNELADGAFEGETPKNDGGESPLVTKFVIAGKKTVLSDNKSHKVNIGIDELEVTFSHTGVPAVGHVYLRGTAVNTTPRPFLPSDKLSIYLDNSFQCVVPLKAVAQKEEFRIFLGVDSTVALRVLPDKTAEKSSGGIFKKEKTKNFKRVIEVKNHGAEEINLAVFEQLPLSATDKIKVIPLQPSQKDLDKDEKDKVFLNEHNNLCFTRHVAPQAKITIPFEYDIVYPGDAPGIVFNEW